MVRSCMTPKAASLHPGVQDEQTQEPEAIWDLFARPMAYLNGADRRLAEAFTLKLKG
jgi:hypothetical protein